MTAARIPPAEEDGGNGGDLPRRLMDAARRDSLTWADRHAIGQAIGRLQSAAKEIHNLNWALSTPGYEKMHDPADQADHEEAVRGTQRFIRMAAAAEQQKALEIDAAKWREHVGKLDALVAFCPTCCEGKTAAADMTRDEVIFQCGRISGKSEAARAAQAQGGA